MDFAKAYSLYKNDKTLQILRAENFPFTGQMPYFFLISFLRLRQISRKNRTDKYIDHAVWLVLS